MQSSLRFFCLCVTLFTLSAFAADKKINSQPTDSSLTTPRPQRENLDYGMYQRIREEAIGHSHVMEYASGLMDGIGPRLTGSPNAKRANEWTRDQLTAMGCSNAHLGAHDLARYGRIYSAGIAVVALDQGRNQCARSLGRY